MKEYEAGKISRTLRVEVTRGWAWDREEFVKINGISVWDDEQVLEMDIGNGYTTL